jgi:hypothetical protein
MTRPGESDLAGLNLIGSILGDALSGPPALKPRLSTPQVRLLTPAVRPKEVIDSQPGQIPPQQAMTIKPLGAAWPFSGCPKQV